MSSIVHKRKDRGRELGRSYFKKKILIVKLPFGRDVKKKNVLGQYHNSIYCETISSFRLAHTTEKTQL